MRSVHRKYQDPLDVIWIRTANDLGIELRRDSTVFASWDGVGTLTIGTAETLDADDSLAQMLLHELCHWLVEGPDAVHEPDWGLRNDPSRVVHEHACLRLQAALADEYGLREFFAATTSFRAYYDRLPADPLSDRSDPAVRLAVPAWHCAKAEPWAAALGRAFRLTADIASIVQDLAPSDSLWSRPGPASLSGGET